MKSKILTCLVLAGLVAAIGWHFWSSRAVTLGPGIKAPDDPVQEELHRPGMIRMDDFSIMPLASFKIEAKVLSRKRYWWGKESKLSPVDLAMGWGAMSDEGVLDYLKIRQSGRWYHWSAKDLPIPKREIQDHSANMHIIPADDEVRRTLKAARKGQIVSIEGYLVRVNHPSGWHWESSLTRTDRGDGACEIIYAKSMRIHD